MKSLSVLVTLEHINSSRVLQKLSASGERQPMAPYLLFLLMSCYGIFDGSSKLTGKTSLFVTGFSYFVGLFLTPNVSLLLGSCATTREWQFSPHLYGKK